MANWVKCIDTHDEEIILNIPAAISIKWIDTQNRTYVGFAGDEDPVLVKEKPQDIITAADLSVSSP